MSFSFFRLEFSLKCPNDKPAVSVFLVRLPVFNDNLSFLFLQGPAAVTSTSRSVVVAEGVAVRRATASVATGGTPASIFRTRPTPTAPDTPTRPALTTAKQTDPQLQQLYSTIGRSLVIGLAHQDFWGAQLEILFISNI